MMFSRYVARLLPLAVNSFKRNVHNLSRIVEVNSQDTIGKHVKVQGWVFAVRKMKDNIFLNVSDGSTCHMLQIVIPKSLKVDKLSYGCSIDAKGELVLAPNGKIELRASDVRVIGVCNVIDGYPFIPRQHYSAEYIRQHLHLRPRTKSFSSLLRLRDIASLAIGNHFRERGFLNVHAPVLTSNDCEGAGEIFFVKPNSSETLKQMEKDNISEDEYYFNTKVYLTVSAQLHLEVVARALTKVYTFGPTFRAENSKSRLHLSEFYMIEAEQAFISNIEDIANEVELLIKNITEEIFEKGVEDLCIVGAPKPQWLNKSFGYLTYTEAVNILNDHSDRLQSPIKYGNSLTKEHELFLVQHHDNTPLFVINWPKEIKSFYMKECENDFSKVAALDLLVPNVGELVGGSIREDNYEKLKLKLPSKITNLSWYLELRKYGNVPSGGFGLGFERYLQFLLGIENIKDTIPFPRWPHNCNL